MELSRTSSIDDGILSPHCARYRAGEEKTLFLKLGSE